MVNALETPTEGKVFVKGVDLTSLKESKLREIRKDIGMIFQEFNLLETKTVFDNIAIPLVLRHDNKQKIKARVEELLKFVGLEDKAKALPGELSGGQNSVLVLQERLLQSLKFYSVMRLPQLLILILQSQS